MNYDPFALKSNPVNEAVNTYGALQGIRLREQEADARTEERGMRREAHGIQMESANLGLEGQQREAARRQKLDRLKPHYQKIMSGEKYDLGEDAALFQELGLVQEGQREFQLPQDEQGAKKVLAQVNPAVAFMDKGVRLEAYGGMKRLLRDIESFENPEALQAVGIDPTRPFVLDRNNAKNLLDNFSRAFAGSLSKGSPGQKDVHRLFVDPRKNTVVPELRIVNADGSVSYGPLTGERSSKANDPVRELPIVGLKGYLRTMADLGDADAKEELTRQRAIETETGKSRAAADALGLSPAAADELAGSGWTAKEAITLLKKEDEEYGTVIKEGVGKDGKPAAILISKSGKYMGEVPVMADDGKGEAGAGKSDRIELKTGRSVTLEDLRKSYESNYGKKDAQGFVIGFEAGAPSWAEFANSQAVNPVFSAAENPQLRVQAEQMAEAWVNEQAKAWNADSTDFKDYGGNRVQAKAAKAQEFYAQLSGQPQQALAAPAAPAGQYASAEEVRAAYRSGQMSREQAAAILRSDFGMN